MKIFYVQQWRKISALLHPKHLSGLKLNNLFLLFGFVMQMCWGRDEVWSNGLLGFESMLSGFRI
jgi:hypothetical protein